MLTPITDRDRETLRYWVRIYREWRFQPLPSSREAKKPLIKYADYWDRSFETDPFEGVETTNCQVMCGRHWKLLVIDLDGPEATAEFQRRIQAPITWTTTSGGGGQHLWFRLPDDYPHPLMKAVLWRGEGLHSAIERLCDRSLVIAPPSIHPKTGHRYTWASWVQSPESRKPPAMAPRRLLEWRPIQIPSTLPKASWVIVDDIQRRVVQWGVRLAGKANSRGWIPCHAIDREDRHPSAAIHRESGYYVDLGSGEKMSLFGLAVRLGVYRDEREARIELGGMR